MRFLLNKNEVSAKHPSLRSHIDTQNVDNPSLSTFEVLGGEPT